MDYRERRAAGNIKEGKRKRTKGWKRVEVNLTR